MLDRNQNLRVKLGYIKSNKGIQSLEELQD